MGEISTSAITAGTYKWPDLQRAAVELLDQQGTPSAIEPRIPHSRRPVR